MTESRLAGRYLVKFNNNPTEDDEMEPFGGFSEINIFVDLISPWNEWIADHVIGSLYSAWGSVFFTSAESAISSHLRAPSELFLGWMKSVWGFCCDQHLHHQVLQLIYRCWRVWGQQKLQLHPCEYSPHVGELDLAWWRKHQWKHQQIITIQLWVEAQIEIKLKETQLF